MTSRIIRQRKPNSCPRCSFKPVANILYGFPSMNEKMQENIDAGRLYLGGCVVTFDDPSWVCTRCGLLVYRGGFDPFFWDDKKKDVDEKKQVYRYNEGEVKTVISASNCIEVEDLKLDFLFCEGRWELRVGFRKFEGYMTNPDIIGVLYSENTRTDGGYRGFAFIDLSNNSIVETGVINEQ